jgi:hypothetical protein
MRENDTYLGLAVLRGVSVMELPAPPTPDVAVPVLVQNALSLAQRHASIRRGSDGEERP